VLAVVAGTRPLIDTYISGQLRARLGLFDIESDCGYNSLSL